MTAPKLILVVEDEPSIADNIEYALSTEGFRTHRAETAGAAREFLQGNTPDLIILDVGLPDENGFDFARSLRTDLKTPIIFVTARSDEIDRIVGLELGADDYVVKPFSPRELTARVRAVLRRVQDGAHTPAHNRSFRYGAFELDEDRVLISYQAKVLDLSRYEFRLLRVLLRRPGRVYSREQLMQLAWEEPDMSLERTVDTHIKTIRQKLREISSEELIVTHRGIGYSLKETEA